MSVIIILRSESAEYSHTESEFFVLTRCDYFWLARCESGRSI